MEELNQTVFDSSDALSGSGLIEVMQLPEGQDKVTDAIDRFKDMMFKYNSAMCTLKTRFEILNDEFRVLNNSTPIHGIKSRLKKPKSIMEKLLRKGYPLTFESIEENLNDVAGVRIICSFIEDIYEIAGMLGMQDDIEVLDVRDYIASPKKNGYRSLHLIVAVPVYFSDQKHMYKVEVQIRTIAMDFWASLEHQMKYKKEIEKAAMISAELKSCAEQIAQIDERMQGIRRKICGGVNYDE